MNRKQCPNCGGEMDERLSGFAHDMIDGGWHCADCGAYFEKTYTAGLTRRELIFAAAGISLVGVPASDSFEHKKINNCLVALWYPPGTTKTSVGWIDNHDVARECLDCIEADSKLILPSTTDEHGNRLWEIRVFDLGGSDDRNDSGK